MPVRGALTVEDDCAPHSVRALLEGVGRPKGCTTFPGPVHPLGTKSRRALFAEYLDRFIGGGWLIRQPPFLLLVLVPVLRSF